MARFLVRLPSTERANEATLMLMRQSSDADIRRARSRPNLMVADVDAHDTVVLREMGAQIYEDVQFSVLPPAGLEYPSSGAAYWRAPADRVALAEDSLSDVLDHIKAPQAWAFSRGAGVTIAVVDTGTCGTLPEFPASKRSPIDLPTAFYGQHWSDVKGHGSMCATIAAATRAGGGTYDGVAPDATVLSARTTLSSIDLFNVYDALIEAKRAGSIAGPLVISNSYGLYTCSAPPGLPEDHPYLEMVLAAVDEGAFVVFAAGNNHHDVLCRHDAAACEPNTIWGVNSHDRVISVGTVNKQNSNQDPATPHANSSRGPGQWATVHPKPDCVAPTYGRVVWGCGYQHMDWWGTSGACPQVAGLGALILSANPTLLPDQVADIVRSTCHPLAGEPTCVGHGLIDCEAAVRAAVPTA